jgi:hypothetical protein
VHQDDKRDDCEAVLDTTELADGRRVRRPPAIRAMSLVCDPAR